ADTLTQALFNWASPELLEGYKCEYCDSLNKCYKSNKILRQPKVFIVHFNRIRMDMYGRLYKDDRLIDIPDELFDRHKLRAVIGHSGGISHGHYVAYRRLTPTKWQLISDTESTITGLCKKPYILLYEQI